MSQMTAGRATTASSANSRARTDKNPRAGNGRNRAQGSSSRDANAIRRQLRANVGQKWAEVFETLKSQFPKTVKGAFADEAVAQTWSLAVKTSLKNGQVRVHASGKVISLEDSSFEYYVHAETGLLLENGFLAAARRREQEREQARKAELAGRMRELSPELQVHKLGGKWFAVELQVLTQDDRAAHFDVVLNRTIQFAGREELHALYGRRQVVGKRKRELQYRELRDLQLVNS